MCFKKWFEFFFKKSKLMFSVSSVMDHIMNYGVPYEFIEQKFYANKMAEQSGKLNIL